MNRRNFIGGLLALGFALSGFKPPEPKLPDGGGWQARVCDRYGNGIEGTVVECIMPDGRAYTARSDRHGIATFRDIQVWGDGSAYFTASFSGSAYFTASFSGGEGQ